MFKSLVPERAEVRLLAAAAFVSTFGSGAFIAVNVLFLTRVKDLSVGEVAAALSAGGVAGMLAAILLGHVSDRTSARTMMLWLLCAMTALTLLYLAPLGAGLIIAVVVALSCLDRAVAAVSGALLADVVAEEHRVEARGYVRSAIHLGLTAGAGLAAAPLAWGRESGYNAVIALDAATFVASALIYSRVPRRGTRPRSKDVSRLGVLADRRYVLATFLVGGMSLHFPIVTFALPLWVVSHIGAPAAVISVLIAAKTVGAALLQVPLTRRIADRWPDQRVLLVGGGCLAGGCALLAASAVGGTVAGIAVLLCATVALIIGDVLTSAGQFSVSFKLAPEGRHGQYQGFFSIGPAIAMALAPSLLLAAPLQYGPAGWLVIAAAFLCLPALAAALVLTPRECGLDRQPAANGVLPRS